MVGPDRTRALGFTYAGIAENLALDEALLVAAEGRGDGGAVVRTWEPGSLAVVLGASCRIDDDVEVGRCEADGVPIARRSSGGGTVVVGPGTLNITVILPTDADPALRAVDTAQASILGRIARSLQEFGPPVGVLGHGDLTLLGRKFAGSAQRRLKRTVLVHLSLMYHFPVETIARYLKTPPRQPAYRAGRDHHAFLTNLDLPRPDILTAIRNAWPSSGPPAEIPEALVRELVSERFGDPDWTRRL